MSEVTEVTGTVTQESPVTIKIESCKEDCPICLEKKEKTLHENIVDRINGISKKKASLLESAESAQGAIDVLVKADAEIESGVVPEATLELLRGLLS